MANWTEWMNIGSEIITFLFGNNVNLNVTYNESKINSVTLNAGAISFTSKNVTAGTNSVLADVIFAETDKAFKLSDYKYFMHTLTAGISASYGYPVKCYAKNKTTSELILLCEHTIPPSGTSAFYTDLSNASIDEDEEYYIYFSLGAYNNPVGFDAGTGTWTLSNVVLY